MAIKVETFTPAQARYHLANQALLAALDAMGAAVARNATLPHDALRAAFEEHAAAKRAVIAARVPGGFAN